MTPFPADNHAHAEVPMRTSVIRRFLGLGLAAGLIVGVQAPAASALPTTTLVPIGSDYQPDTLQLFARQAATRGGNAEVHILVIPITYSLLSLIHI